MCVGGASTVFLLIYDCTDLSVAPWCVCAQGYLSAPQRRSSSHLISPQHTSAHLSTPQHTAAHHTTPCLTTPQHTAANHPTPQHTTAQRTSVSHRGHHTLRSPTLARNCCTHPDHPAPPPSPPSCPRSTALNRYPERGCVESAP